MLSADFLLGVFEVDTGKVCVKLQVSEQFVTEPRREDIDERSVLASCGGTVKLFARKQSML